MGILVYSSLWAMQDLYHQSTVSQVFEFHIMDVGSSSARRAYPSTHGLDGLGPETLNPPEVASLLGQFGERKDALHGLHPARLGLGSSGSRGSGRFWGDREVSRWASMFS